MRIAGIDPGLGTSHMVVIEPLYQDCVYGPRARLLSYTTLHTPELWEADWGRCATQNTVAPTVGIVEVARGSIASARAADPVLRNNIIGGMLAAHFNANVCPVVPVASGGAAAWSWRGALGVRGAGAKAKDESIKHFVDALLEGEMPKGPRGGHLVDFYDAAGMALGALCRIMARPGLSPLEALTLPTELDKRKQAINQTSRQARKTARAYQKTRLEDVDAYDAKQARQRAKRSS